MGMQAFRPAYALRGNKKRRQEQTVPDAFVRLQGLDYHSAEGLSIKTGKFLNAEKNSSDAAGFSGMYSYDKMVSNEAYAETSGGMQ
jgi:hypothetical protein